MARGNDAVYRLVNGLGRGLLRAIAADIRWTGLEHLPTSGPVVLAANHVSYPDFVVLERAAVERGRYVRFLCRYDVWDVHPLVGWAMDRMGHVPVDRRAAAYALRRGRALLEAGEVVGIFPEAGISWSYTVRALMPGAVALALETGAPLVPVAVWGGQRILPVGDPQPPLDPTRHRRVDLAFGAPLALEPGDDVRDATARLGLRLTDLLEGLQRLPRHRPRPGEVATWYPAHLGGRAASVQQAAVLDQVPFSAVAPTWGPGPGPGDAAAGSRSSRAPAG